MDSGVYKYFIAKLQSDAVARFDFLPLHFAKSAVNTTPEAFRSLAFFLTGITRQGKPAHTVAPCMSGHEISFFNVLFLLVHKAILDILSGHNAMSHDFRTNGIQLTRFLVFCSRDDGALFVPMPGPVEYAMLCFLSEGMMHTGWCPNGFEGQAKRAAHSYFIGLKKSLLRAGPEDIAMVCGYLWGAWLLAQKTEGIRSDASSSPKGGENRQNLPSETFCWKSPMGPRTFCAKKSAATGLFYILSKSPLSLPHPFACLRNDGRVGLSVRINNEPVKPVSPADFSDIKRQNISGERFIYNCATDSITCIVWTIAFLTYQCTLYRIDTLKFPEETKTIHFDAEMKLECGIKTEQIGDNSFLGRGMENVIIRFLDSPFTFGFDRCEHNGISVFHALGNHSGNALKLVTAWATGRGITAINETKLLGIYD